MDYDPGRFSDVAATPLGAALWALLNRPDNVLRMETASQLGRVAVEPLGPVLLRELGEAARAPRAKQAAGHMARQILERRGWRVDRSNVRIARPGLFRAGTRFAPDAAAAPAAPAGAAR